MNISRVKNFGDFYAVTPFKNNQTQRKPLPPTNPDSFVRTSNAGLAFTSMPDSKKDKKHNLKPLYYALGAAGAIGVGLLAHKMLFKGIKAHKFTKANPVGHVVENIPNYRQSLVEGIEKTFGIKIKPESLTCIPDNKEFNQIVNSLTEENYILSPKNIQEGIYRADLHSHSNISDGKANPLDILEQARKYSDELFQKTGRKFTFALSDHDSVDGVVEILGQIAKEPERYNNLQFIPAVELSFAHIADKSANRTETSELLAFCVNPFDKKLRKHLQGLHDKRRTMIQSAIEEFQKKFPHAQFSTEEFSRFYGIDMKKDMHAANLHWKVTHYGQTKLAVTDLAKQQGKDAEQYYEQIMQKTGKDKALGNLKDLGLIPYHIHENDEISKIRKALQPIIQDDKSISAVGEATSADIFKSLKNQDCTLAFAHPYYFQERLYTPYFMFKSLIAESKGKLTMAEGYHQAYAKTVDRNKITAQNRMFESLGLKLIGGQDNHTQNLFL